MTPNKYQQEALRTEYTPDCIRANRAKEDNTDFGKTCEAAVTEDQRLARILHGMIGMATEVGELQDAVKKHLIYSKPLDMVNVMEECGDVLWYVALTLHAADYTFEDCMQRNIDKLRKRFPDKFTSELANNRDLDAERSALEADGAQDTTPETRTDVEFYGSGNPYNG